MIKLQIVDGSLQVSNNGTVILVAPKNSCAIDVLALYDAIPMVVIYNKYLGNATNIFTQPLSNCEDSTNTPFDVNTFIAFAEANFGFDTTGGCSTGGCVSPFKYNANLTGIEPVLGNNNSTGTYGTIGGGCLNSASGNQSVIGGGISNNSSGYKSTISGGAFNTTCGLNSAISGGICNTALGTSSFVGGGSTNRACSSFSNIVGGSLNTAYAIGSLVVGGVSNTASATNSVVGGGAYNTSSGEASSIVGGCRNNATGYYAFVGAGTSNTASSRRSVVVGGDTNLASGVYSFIGSGNQHKACGCKSFIGGGEYNLSFSPFSSVVGGFANKSCGNNSFIGSGGYNIANGNYSFIGGGRSNTTCYSYSFVGGGRSNVASNQYSTIAGGNSNTASAKNSFVSGGSYNISSGCYSFIGGGKFSTASGCGSFIGGGANPLFLGHIASGISSVIVGGVKNTASGNYSSIGGGCSNIASGISSVIVGGVSNNTNNYSCAMIVGSNISANRACTTFVNDLIIASMSACSGCSVRLSTDGLFTANSLTGGVHAFIKPSAGCSVSSSNGSSALVTLAGSANRLQVAPFIPAQTITSASLYINVSSLLAGSNAQIVIYSDLNGKPNTKLYQSANLDCATTGIKTATTVQTFVAGTTYWIGVQTSSTQTLSAIDLRSTITIGSSGTTIYNQFYITPAFGSAPSSFGAGNIIAGSVPFIGITL